MSSLALSPSFISPVISAPFPSLHHSFSNFQYPLLPPPLASGECPLIVTAASEAGLAVAAGGG